MAQKVRIIGVPMDLGQSRRGVDMGPSALRGAGLQARIKQIGVNVEDIGNLEVKQPEEMQVGEKRAKYLQEIAETCRDLATTVEKSLGEGFLPLVLGGDHSIAAGVAAGVASHYRKDKKEIGYLWLDAHGDMNTPESSPSGNVHGMPLASIMGYGPSELVGSHGLQAESRAGNIVIVGARDLDAQERKIAKKSGIHVFTMRDIDERGMREVMADALKYAMDDTAGIAVSLDMDFRRSERRARRRHARPRRRHLPRSSPRHGNDCRLRSHGLPRSRRNKSHHRRTQPHRAPRRRAGPLRPRQKNPVIDSYFRVE